MAPVRRRRVAERERAEVESSGPPLNNTQMPRMSRTPASVVSATPRTALTEIGVAGTQRWPVRSTTTPAGICTGDLAQRCGRECADDRVSPMAMVIRQHRQHGGATSGKLAEG
jgi:hypothetical protein